MICSNDAFKGLKKRFRRAVITSSLARPSWDGGISVGNAEAVLAAPARRTTTRFPLQKKSNKTGKIVRSRRSDSEVSHGHLGNHQHLLLFLRALREEKEVSLLLTFPQTFISP